MRHRRPLFGDEPPAKPIDTSRSPYDPVTEQLPSLTEGDWLKFNDDMEAELDRQAKEKQK